MLKKAPLPRIIFITDTTRVDVIAVAKKLPRGSGVILRDYQMERKDRLDLGRKLRSICQLRHLIFLVARDVELARELKADGIHFPEYLHYNIRRTRKHRPQWIILAAAHSAKAARSALEAGASAILFSPVYKTKSHPEAKEIGHFRAAAKIRNQLGKAYALGGITPNKAKTLESLGFLGFAAISGLELCGHHATVPLQTSKK